MQSILHLPSPSPPVARLHPRTVKANSNRGPVTASATPTLTPPPADVTEKRIIAPTPDTPSAAYWDYQFLFLSQRAESQSPINLRVVEGSVPSDFPRGTYYLTGPGMFTDDHGSTVHPLDGHGYLRAFDFGDDGEVHYSARYIKTEAQREEMGSGAQWRFTHRGPFSVLKGGKKMGNVKVMKNVANTSVVIWGGRLMCMWEGGDPYEVDQETLETVGTVDLIGGEGDRRTMGVERPRTRAGLKGIGVDVAARILKPILHGIFRMPPKRLLSHYKIDPERNRLLVLSCNAEDMLLPRSNFTFYEFDCNFKLMQKKDFVIPDQLMIHDWAFTGNNYIIIGNRIKLDVPGSVLAVSGLSPMISALSVNPSQPTSPIYLLPRFSEETVDSQRRDWRVPIEAPSQLWVLHIGNAFEEKNGRGDVDIQLHASVCSYLWFNFQKMFGYNWETGRLDPSFMNVVEDKGASLPHLVQISIKLNANANHQCSIDTPSDQWKRSADFPAINPTYAGRRNSFTYAGASSGCRRYLPHFPFDTVLKLNGCDGMVGSWWAGKRSFIGEPIFVGRGTEEEDDGYILVVEYAVSKQKCYLVILEAKLIGRANANALVAKLEVPKHLNFPLGFHGFWASR